MRAFLLPLQRAIPGSNENYWHERRTGVTADNNAAVVNMRQDECSYRTFLKVYISVVPRLLNLIEATIDIRYETGYVLSVNFECRMTPRLRTEVLVLSRFRRRWLFRAHARVAAMSLLRLVKHVANSWDCVPEAGLKSTIWTDRIYAVAPWYVTRHPQTMAVDQGLHRH